MMTVTVIFKLLPRVTGVEATSVEMERFAEFLMPVEVARFDVVMLKIQP